MASLNHQPAGSTASVQSLLEELLVCPRDRQSLRREGTKLICHQGHSYPVVEGVPILLVAEVEQTHVEGSRALALANTGDASSFRKFDVGPNEIDPFVQNAIAATNGSLYQHLVGNLKEYPIPRLRLPPGEGLAFLEVGCSWGRWCIAAARMGYRPIGIDPSLKSIRAAIRVARQLGIDAAYVVADSRFLPFPGESFDQIFSYSVLQHLSKQNASASLSEMQRVMHTGAGALVQMPNVYGVRCLYHQMRRGFREGRDFEVRYWTPRELRETFAEKIGPSEMTVDGYFSLNVQPSDLHLLLARYRPIVHVSESLRRMSEKIPALMKIADSLYIRARRAD